MRSTLCLAVISAVFSSGLAETWSGRLLDATCYDKQTCNDKQKSGDPGSTTIAFALTAASGKTLKLDAAGNSKASAALKNRADRSDPAKPQSKQVMASVTGTESGGTIAVESIQVQ